MTAFLNSPYTIGACLLLLLAWVTAVCAIFWPQRAPVKRDDTDARF